MNRIDALNFGGIDSDITGEFHFRISTFINFEYFVLIDSYKYRNNNLYDIL